MVGVNSIPHWLESLLLAKFFNPCAIHEFAKKNEKNIFCLDCCTSICPLCVPTHRSHRLLQIRRYVYHDVTRLSDAQRLMNCSFVQPYTTNSAKVVFLNQRPMSRPFRDSGKFCITCDRGLQDPYLFCSLSCKVHQWVTANSGNTELLPIPSRLKDGSECLLELEDNGQPTRDSILDSPVSLSTSITASASGVGVSEVGCDTLADGSPAVPESGKKKNSRLKSMPPDSSRNRRSPSMEISVALNRRKAVPRRSPLN
ncbi:hypothetical protein CJ030_MR4G021278 [Morella rubra]|uniref:B box-type domain-containing protein n=1 Tax=Morella rubra TaxID=262757 RepID=A0A6A1VW79_9ROSI|nr:hypothetical protein CJ030_MR4G021278 [Morella rubra]